MNPLDLLNQEDFDNLAKQFNGQIAAGAPKGNGEEVDQGYKSRPIPGKSSPDAPQNKGGAFDDLVAAPEMKNSPQQKPFDFMSAAQSFNPSDPARVDSPGTGGEAAATGGQLQNSQEPRVINIPQPQFTPQQMASWPRTLGWSGANRLPPRTADDFFGPSGNILSSLTDVDRVNNPFAFDAAMNRLQDTQLGRQTAIDRNNLGKSEIQNRTDLAAGQNATELEKARIAAKGHIDAAAMGHSRDARSARIEDTLISQGIASGRSPAAIAASLAQMRNLKILGSPADSGTQVKPGSNMNIMGLDLPVHITNSGPDAPTIQQTLNAEGIEKSMREIFGTTPNEKGVVGAPKALTPELMDQFISKLPNDPDTIKHLMEQITGSSRIAGDPIAFGDQLAKSLAYMSGQVGDIYPSDPKNVRAPSLSKSVPYMQFNPNLNWGGVVTRSMLNPLKEHTDLNEIQFPGISRKVPLGVSDLPSLRKELVTDKAEVGQRIAPASNLLYQMIMSGAYK